jgi:hypothetical protein
MDLSPVPWDTLLLILEGESVLAPTKGQPAVVVHTPPAMIITTQQRPVYRTKQNATNDAEQMAFQNRLALRWHLKNPLPAADPQLKLCYSCRGCYSRLIDAWSSAWIEDHPEQEAEVSSVAAALARKAAHAAAAKRARLEGPSSTVSSASMQACSGSEPAAPAQTSSRQGRRSDIPGSSNVTAVAHMLAPDPASVTVVASDDLVVLPLASVDVTSPSAHDIDLSRTPHAADVEAQLGMPDAWGLLSPQALSVGHPYTPEGPPPESHPLHQLLPAGWKPRTPERPPFQAGSGAARPSTPLRRTTVLLPPHTPSPRRRVCPPPPPPPPRSWPSWG